MNNETRLLPVVKIPVTRHNLLAMVTILFVFVGISLLLWLERDTEVRMVIHHNPVYENPFALAFWRWITRYGMSVICLIYAAVIFFFIKKKIPNPVQPVFLSVVFSFVMAGIAGDLIKEAIQRSRPAAELLGQLAIPFIPGSMSLPSGHGTKCMALVLPFLFFAPHKTRAIRLVRVILLVVALLVMYSRIALQFHYISDLTASVAVALVFTPIAAWLANGIYALKKMNETQLVVMNKRLIGVYIGLAIIIPFI